MIPWKVWCCFILDVESRVSTIHQDTSFIDDDKTTLAKHDALMYWCNATQGVTLT